MSIRITPLPGEEVLLVQHKSFFKHWRLFLTATVFVILGSVGLYFGANEYLFLFSIFSFIFSFIFALIIFSIWYGDLYLVSNLRVITIDKMGLFGHSYGETDARDIIGVGYSYKGFLEALTRTGTVEIRTLSNESVLLPDAINPQALHEVVRTVSSVHTHGPKI